jgi:hypothetical protein
MTRLMLTAALLIAIGASPAEACHRFSVWKYPWPQQCGRLPLAKSNQTRKTGDFVNRGLKMRGYDAWKTRSDRDDWAALNHKEEVEGPPIPLPALTPIDGEEADDEARARIELRALLEAK